jgi:uncharacterized membrane-anchored protein
MTPTFTTERPANIWIGAVAVALILSAALAWMVYGRVSLLKTGREMTVEVIPVDPRDFFRGDYVILGYTFTTTGDVMLPAGTKMGDRIYATLKPEGGSKWSLLKVSANYPDRVEAEHRVLRGVARFVSRGRSVSDTEPTPGRVAYGIESYFVPEGTGRELETKILEKKIEVVLAVAENGESAIKALLVDGKRVHEEPIL